MEIMYVLKERVTSSNLPFQKGIKPLRDESLVAAAIFAEVIDVKINYVDGVTFDVFGDQLPQISLFFHKVEHATEPIFAEELFDNSGNKQVVIFPWKPL